LTRLNRQQEYTRVRRPFEVTHEQTHGNTVSARVVPGRPATLQKCHRSRGRVQIDRINHYDGVGLVLLDLAEVVFRSILSIDHVHAWTLGDLSRHMASRCVIGSARIANAHHDHIALRRTEKLFPQVHITQHR